MPDPSSAFVLGASGHGIAMGSPWREGQDETRTTMPELQPQAIERPGPLLPNMRWGRQPKSAHQEMHPGGTREEAAGEEQILRGLQRATGER